MKIPVMVEEADLKAALNQVETPEQERPSERERQHKYDVPVIKFVDTHIPVHGKYRTPSGKARGLVVHYTAGRMSHPEGVLSYLGGQGLGCMVMDKDGIIYVAKNQGFEQVAYHAGSSNWKGVSGTSYYCMGMEIQGAGLLTKKGDKFVAWYGEEIPIENVRYVPAGRHNMVAGYYQRYTDAQEKALKNFCLWQKDVNPEFDFDWVIGHDECAVPKGRKQDPGGSLSMSMPEFRAWLKDA